MKVVVDRQSVCMADDVFPHERAFELDETLTIGQFLSFLATVYLAPISGNDVVWGLEKNGVTISHYFTKEDRSTNPESLLKDIITQYNGDYYFYVRYYGHISRYEKWLEQYRH